MADTITQEQLQELRRDVEETKWLTFHGPADVDREGEGRPGRLPSCGSGWTTTCTASTGARRYAVARDGTAYARLIDVAVKGVGRVTMRHQSAMAERGLTFAEAS